MCEPKQVIVLRKDLGMRKGKMAAQAAHASMASIIPRISHDAILPADGSFTLFLDKASQEWLKGSFVKIVVGVDSEKELLEVYDKAVISDVRCSVILDSGRTEFHDVPTYTAVAVGPADPKLVDSITGSLKLL